jgi:hypothetical protein
VEFAEKLLLLASGSLLAVSALAQTASTPGSGTSPGTSEPTPGGVQDGFFKQGGSVYFIKNGRPQKVDREMRLAEGGTAERDGEVTLRDGAKVTLKEGQMITLDDKIMMAPPGIRTGGGEGRGGTER